MSFRSMSVESGISSNTESEPITPEAFDGLELQDAIMSIQNLLEYNRNCKANHEVLNSSADLLKNKLQEISIRTDMMKKLLEKQEKVDQKVKEKSQKFGQLLAQFKEICSTNQVTATDKDIDRLLYKINVMRTITQTLLTEHASRGIRFNDNLALLDIMRHVSDSRSRQTYQDKLEKRKISETTATNTNLS